VTPGAPLDAVVAVACGALVAVGAEVGDADMAVGGTGVAGGLVGAVVGAGGAVGAAGAAGGAQAASKFSASARLPRIPAMRLSASRRVM
jgi:hypothetical protein